ncbi:MAG: hypothetical protein JWQ90_3034 [Hydrocarboniphaga sp.]|uniref:efflux RND transporter permease subunit n=1 Tax=Hydrocarboniphaga sp. TaxID=2033016 RepID=UPI0026276DE4|nr:MMPL family transporter [Hydrocarboniphaga sp.]MDB5970584.1 hypothetical protein [Hydrocarboniphaga sp.]
MHGEAQGKFSKAFVRVTEPIVFGNRPRTLVAIFLMTLFMVWQALHLQLDTGYEKQLPLGHPYMKVFKQYQQEFGGGNIVLFSLQQKKGDIYTPEFMETLRKLTQSVFFTKGVDRARVSSLFTPDVRYLETVEDGFRGGNVIPAEYAATPEMVEIIKSNTAKAKAIGRYVTNDQTGAMVFSELLEHDPMTGKRMDYLATAKLIEDVRQHFINPKVYDYKLKADKEGLKAGAVIDSVYTDPRKFTFRFHKIEVADPADAAKTVSVRGSDVDVIERDNPDYNAGVDIHIVGFAKVVGDIGDATFEVVGFFGLALLLTWIVLWWYTGSPLIALLPLSCGLLAVVWELGMLHMAGFGLDPFAILVPFLVLAISVSHGIQITSFWLLEVAERGASSFDASRNTYKRLVTPGITALVTNVVGFGTILLIPVGIIREMAINAMFGLLAVIVCKKILLPCLLSYAHLGDPARFRSYQRKRDANFEPLWRALSAITLKPVAAVVLVVAFAGWGGAEYISKQLKIGELHDGVPELRPDSRYNQDSASIAANYSIGVELIKVIAENKADGCIDYSIMEEIDRFAYRMQNTPGVQSTLSLPQLGKLVYGAFNEGNPKYQVLPRSSDGLVLAGQQFPTSTGFLNNDCSAIPVLIFMTDHKAETINTVIKAVNEFIKEQGPNPQVQFKLATGNVGVMAATNDVIRDTEHTVLFWLFLCIGICVWLSFRSIGSLICVLLPLWMVSVITYAVMVFLDIGLKVSTLPVAAFAAGIGVDYGIYIYSVLEECINNGMTLRKAYETTLKQTGKAVVVTALALAASVCTWLLSGLQFQVDMGILLTIMFLANAAAAVLLLPAFAAFLVKAKPVAADAAHGDAASA